MFSIIPAHSYTVDRLEPLHKALYSSNMAIVYTDAHLCAQLEECHSFQVEHTYGQLYRDFPQKQRMQNTLTIAGRLVESPKVPVVIKHLIVKVGIQRYIKSEMRILNILSKVQATHVAAVGSHFRRKTQSRDISVSANTALCISLEREKPDIMVASNGIPASIVVPDEIWMLAATVCYFRQN